MHDEIKVKSVFQVKTRGRGVLPRGFRRDMGIGTGDHLLILKEANGSFSMIPLEKIFDSSTILDVVCPDERGRILFTDEIQKKMGVNAGDFLALTDKGEDKYGIYRVSEEQFDVNRTKNKEK